MTDITDQDRRDALRWAEAIRNSDAPCAADLWHAAARVILATVDAPAPNLAERLREQFYNPDPTDEQYGIILDAEQMEQDAGDRQEWNRRITEQSATLTRERDEARAGVERLSAEVERLAAERDEARNNEATDSLRQRAEAWSKVWNHPVMRPAVARGGSALSRALELLDRLHSAQEAVKNTEQAPSPDERNTHTHSDSDPFAAAKEAARYAINATRPDPADVKPGEAWLVSCGSDEPGPGFRRGDGQRLPWVISNDDTIVHTSDNHITLVRRLAPEPRTITNHDELDTMPNGSVVLEDEVVYQRGYSHSTLGERWYASGEEHGYTTEQLIAHGPVTVLREPNT